PAFIPEEYVAEAIAPGLGEVAGERILLPRAEIAREALAAELRQRGATVDEIAAYRTLPAAPDPVWLAELRRGVDAITFTSASTVRNFAVLTAQTREVFETSRVSPIIACIGPITAAAAREAGLPVHIIAPREAYTTDGLLAALTDYFSRQP
ncbi:MAG: uroporphyrinogen-III synthase, partial [Chloroflexi bacterium]|nr:uroporphyrinogen-III synthase [Chloroflexota bacterium]